MSAVDVTLHRVQIMAKLVSNQVGEIIEHDLLDGPVLDALNVLVETLEQKIEDLKAAVELERQCAKGKPAAPPA